ncbi:MAG: helix-turn-helix domain-containing protein [Opitutaceae bacterium]|nr:helix-turn-helix domain-containing protein [Opitutaceae bacterium]
MTFHSVERLGAPYASVSEVGFVIPTGSEINLSNVEHKIVFYLKARCRLVIEGEGEFAVEAGDVLVVPRRCVQRYRAGQGGAAQLHALKILFSLPPLPAKGARPVPTEGLGDPEADLTAFVQHHFRQIRYLRGAQTAAIQEILRAIRHETEHHGPGIRHRVRALCTNLVVHVARRLHEPISAPHASAMGSGAGAVVVQAKEYLIRNHARELTLGEVAWSVRKSEEHLARVFRRVTGQTVFDYLRTVRLEMAKTLLINSEKTLTEIASASGFGSLALFSRNFKHYVGNSPSIYRQQRSQAVVWRPSA